ncbi:hypothetical protein TanjilG_03736 [Lupinus angustifolius]|uniref:Uncharacterized protein n=1 Tax=Lupinus angustifolius TaxID=3871 RepID=A0A1J7HWP6_LUPAN|nr:hypothetical protein TanjilG_03736 [Lupinus angustifolius]
MKRKLTKKPTPVMEAKGDDLIIDLNIDHTINVEGLAKVDLVSDEEVSSDDSHQGETVPIEVPGNVVDTIEPEVVRTQHEPPNPQVVTSLFKTSRK